MSPRAFFICGDVLSEPLRALQPFRFTDPPSMRMWGRVSDPPVDPRYGAQEDRRGQTKGKEAAGR
jgi:hypothetical protein